ncbi:MAG TPA: glycosyltransferase, partial [Pyrinomonadaceae bacterium]|nr:glycosyltransferase [Pyrinomonadaceae bacterium]
FRREHGLADRFVVMYSGNHSPCHPLDTLLAAALNLKGCDDVMFCFVGGGSEQEKVNDFASRHELTNIKVLPYQPLDSLSASLSAADLHVVVMGEQFVGIVHPCKIYNIMSVGAPMLYIGPQPSHVTDIASHNETKELFLTHHGDVNSVAESILLAREQQARVQETRIFRKDRILPQLVNAIGGTNVENVFRALPDSDNSLTDYHAAH